MAERILDFDPLTGETTTFEYHADDSFTIGYLQDVEPLIERNKKLAADPDYGKSGIKQNWMHYASIPPVIIMKWKNELGVDLFNKNHEKRVMELINSPEYQYLRVTNYHHDKC